MNQLVTETPHHAAQRLAAKQLAQGYQFLMLHAYADEQNKPLYWRIRLKHPTTHQKWICPMHQMETGEYLLKEPAFPQGKPLYRLPEIIQHSNETVWIVEGEQCADQLAKLGFIVTTSGGVESVDNTDWSPLQNRNIMIWRDNDAPGLRYAEAVTMKLQSLNCNVQWIDVDALALSAKGDCVDWVAEHADATKEIIASLLAVTPVLQETSQSKEITQTSKPTTVSCFRVTEQGVYHNPPDSDPLFICSKLEIKALVRDSASENWGRLLVFHDADHCEHTWAMPMQMLKGSGEELRSELLRMGLEMAASKRARNLLMEYITSSKPEQRARCVTRTGWYRHVFVFPHITIGECSETILYQSENPVRDYTQAGTLTDWQQQVAAYCCGNSRLVLSVSMAFAAMLLYPTGSESGGINLVGESSIGKTTALRVAASVYGAPDYLSRWRATTNGLEALAALRSDTLLILDELAQVDPKEAGEIVYMLANGSGKTRAAKTGTTRPKHEWRLLFLSAGEIGLAQHMQEVGKRAKAGQEVRLVDIPADAGCGLGLFENLHQASSSAELSKHLIEHSQKYYGVAATAFLEKITTPKCFQDLNKQIHEHRRVFIASQLPLNASGQVVRVCERFALIAAAGELATECGITDWPAGEAIDMVAVCFKAWLEQRGGVENQERHQILIQVRAFFEAHGESRFTDWHADHSKTINRAGFKSHHHEDGLRFYVLPQIFRNEICNGLDYHLACKFLIEVGWLLPSESKEPYRREYLPGIGRSRCYLFTSRLWQD